MLEGHHEPVMTSRDVTVDKDFPEANTASVQLNLDNKSPARASVTHVRADCSKEERAKAVFVSPAGRQRRRPPRLAVRNVDAAQRGATDGTQNYSSPQKQPSLLSVRTDSATSICIGDQGVCGGYVGNGGDGGDDDNPKSCGGNEETNHENILCLSFSSTPAEHDDPRPGRIVYVHALENKVMSALGTTAIEYQGASTGPPVSATLVLQDDTKQIEDNLTNIAAEESHSKTALSAASDSGLESHSAAENARLAGILRAALRAVAASNKDYCDDSIQEKEPGVKAKFLSTCPTPAKSSGRDRDCSGCCCSHCSRCCGNKSPLLLEKATETEPEAAVPAAAAVESVVATATAAAATAAAAAAASQALAKEKAKVILLLWLGI